MVLLFLVSVVTVLFTTFIVGTIIFLWQQNEINQLKQNYESRISGLNDTSDQLLRQLDDANLEIINLTSQLEALKKDPMICVDSDVNEKADDIYVKGTVTYTDEKGYESTAVDECTGSKEQVNEMWCYPDPSGSGGYVQGRMVYDCPKGCLDGACIK